MYLPHTATAEEVSGSGCGGSGQGHANKKLFILYFWVAVCVSGNSRYGALGLQVDYGKTLREHLKHLFKQPPDRHVVSVFAVKLNLTG